MALRLCGRSFPGDREPLAGDSVFSNCAGPSIRGRNGARSMGAFEGTDKRLRAVSWGAQGVEHRIKTASTLRNHRFAHDGDAASFQARVNKKRSQTIHIRLLPMRRSCFRFSERSFLRALPIFVLFARTACRRNRQCSFLASHFAVHGH